MVCPDTVGIPLFRGMTPQGILAYGMYSVVYGKEYIYPARYNNTIRVEIVPGTMDFFTGEYDVDGVPMYRGDEVVMVTPGGEYHGRSTIVWQLGSFYLYRPHPDPLRNMMSYTRFDEWLPAVRVVGNRHKEK